MASEVEKILDDANTLLNNGELSDAEALLRNLLRKNTSNLQCLLQLIQVLLVRERWADALDITDRLAALTRDAQITRLYRAHIFSEVGRKDDASHEVSLLSYDNLPNGVRALWFDVLLNKLGRVKQGVAVGKKHFKDLQPASLKLLLFAAVRVGEAEFARKCGERLISTGVDDIEIRRALYSLEIGVGSSDLARQHLRAFSTEQNLPFNQDFEDELARIESMQFAFMHAPKTSGTSSRKTIDQIGANLSHRAIK